MPTEIKTKLTLDDNASRVLDDIEGEFREVEDSAENTQSAIKEFGTQFAATLAAVSVGPILRQLKDLSGEILTTTNSAYDAQQSIAGMMAGMSGARWAEARHGAEAVHAELTELAVTIGQNKNDIIAGQREMVTFMGSTREAFDITNRNMKNLVTIANVTGFSVQQIASGFGQMAGGIVQMRSPMFHLLRSTGIFSDDIAKVNKEWRELTQQERISRLETAFGNVAGNLATAKPTMTDLLTSFKEFGTEFVETFGSAAIKEIIPQFDELRQAFFEGRGEFKQIAKEWGRDAGKFIGEVIEDFQDGAEYIKNHAQDIKEAVVEGFTFARDVVQFIVDNKEVIAGVLGARMAVGAVNTVAPGIAAGGARAAGGMLGKAAGAIPGVISAIVAGGPAVWAFAGAVTAVGAGAALAVHHIEKGYQEQEDIVRRGMDEYKRILEEGMAGLTKAEYKRLDALQLEMEHAAANIGKTVKQVLGKSLVEIEAPIKELKDTIVRPILEADEKIAMAREKTPLIRSKFAMGDQMSEEELVAFDQFNAILSARTQQAVGAWNAAVDMQDEAMMEMAASVIAQSGSLRDTFAQTADMTADGFELLKETLLKHGGVFEQALAGDIEQRLRSQSLADQAIQSPVMNFNGNTWNIQQDFRDQDPDRIAVVFRRDVTRRAISRLQPRTASPFGT